MAKNPAATPRAKGLPGDQSGHFGPDEAEGLKRGPECHAAVSGFYRVNEVLTSLSLALLSLLLLPLPAPPCLALQLSLVLQHRSAPLSLHVGGMDF